MNKIQQSKTKRENGLNRLQIAKLINKSNLRLHSAFGKLSWKTTEEKKARGGVGMVNPHSSRLNKAILKSTKKIRLDLESPEAVLGLG